MISSMKVLYREDSKKLVTGISVIAISFVVGILVGHFGINDGEGGDGRSRMVRRASSDEQESIKEIIGAIDADNIKTFLQTLTAVPHIAAGERDK